MRKLILICAVIGCAVFMIAGVSNYDILRLKEKVAADTCEDTKCLKLQIHPQ